MDVLISTLCDSATDYSGKLCLLGAFDTIGGTQLPIRHRHMALALRICFRPGDEGEHDLEVNFIDPDGQPVTDPNGQAMQPIRGKMPVRLPPGDITFVSHNIVMDFPPMAFAAAGNYSLDVKVDGEMFTRVPLRVLLIDPNQIQGGPPGAPPQSAAPKEEDEDEPAS